MNTYTIYTARPIYFPTEEVIKIKRGLKTETRRPIERVAPYTLGEILVVQERCAKTPNGYIYFADGAGGPETQWIPSTKMPRDAGRIFLRVEGVRQERLQEISPYSLRFEGIGECGQDPAVTRNLFREMWDKSVNRNPVMYEKLRWDVDPIVWVFTFKRARICQLRRRK